MTYLPGIHLKFILPALAKGHENVYLTLHDAVQVTNECLETPATIYTPQYHQIWALSCNNILMKAFNCIICNQVYGADKTH